MSTRDHGGGLGGDEALGIHGAVRVRWWFVDDLEAAHPGWSDLPRAERHAMLADPERWPAAPVHEGVTSNLVTDGYLESLAAGRCLTPSHLALGDGTTAPAGTNTTLNNEVYRVQVGQDETDGKDRLTSTYISQNEANGEALREVGFANGDRSDVWTLMTHTVLDATDQIDEKTSNMTLTVDYVLLYRRGA